MPDRIDLEQIQYFFRFDATKKQMEILDTEKSLRQQLQGIDGFTIHNQTGQHMRYASGASSVLSSYGKDVSPNNYH